MAEFANGRVTAVIATFDPVKLEALLEYHAREEDDGDFDEAADARLEALGFDLEFLDEPLWALREGDEPDPLIGECLAIA